MATYTIKPTGGDFATLAAALSDAGTTTGDIFNISGDWTTRDSTVATVADNNITIQTVAADQARHSGVDNGTTNYALITTSGHCLTVNNTGCTLDGFIIKQAGTGASDEGIRFAASGGTLTCKNMIIWTGAVTTDQDGIYIGNIAGTITLENCFIHGFERGGLKLQNFNDQAVTQTANLNSCGFYNNGHSAGAAGSSDTGGGISVFRGGFGTYVINGMNTWSLENDTGTGQNADFDVSGAGGTITWGLSFCIDSDGSTSVDAGGTGNLTSRTLTDNTSPGAGAWVIVQDITVGVDLRLVSNAENDAQDAHTTATAEGLTIPATDIAGTSRPQNTNYDIGAFEIVVGGGGGASIAVLADHYRRLMAA